MANIVLKRNTILCPNFPLPVSAPSTGSVTKTALA